MGKERGKGSRFRGITVCKFSIKHYLEMSMRLRGTPNE
jgi:hypothetical protein